MSTTPRIEQMLKNYKHESIGESAYKLALVCDALLDRIVELEKNVENLKRDVEFVQTHSTTINL